MTHIRAHQKSNVYEHKNSNKTEALKQSVEPHYKGRQQPI